jgi:site-specific recombinase XerD
MKIFYYSIYGQLFEQFTELKRGLGYKYKEVEYVLSALDKLVVEREETEIGLSKELCDRWSEKRPNESSKTRYSRVQIIRQFSCFLSTMGYPSHIQQLPKHRTNFTPYVFTKEQINALLEKSDQIKPVRHNLESVRLIIPALLRLLYATGLRVSEALMLQLKDVHLDKKHFVVRSGKNLKDRMVPFSDSLYEVLKQYIEYRSSFPIIKDSGRLFIKPDGSTCPGTTIYKWYRKILYRAGIPHAGKGLGPRLHDFRHTFAVHSLAQMAEAGVDLYYSLPVLSTYLGHQSISATDKYVRLTAEMYPSLIAKVNPTCMHLFPELFKEQNNETKTN